MRAVADTIQLNQPIPVDLHRKAKVRAAEEGVTLSAFVIAALNSALDLKVIDEGARP